MDTTKLPIPRGPYDQLTGVDLQRVEKWDKDKEAQALFQAQFREFIETKPLYSWFKLTLPPGRTQFYLDVARLFCDKCQTLQPFRQPEIAQWYHVHDKELRFSEKQIRRTLGLIDELHLST